jgi:lysozyme
MSILLADISRYQGAGVNFAALRRAGVRGVYIECYRGNDGSNPHYAEQVAGARAAGLAVGAYLFAYPLPDAAGHVDRDPIGQVALFFAHALGVGTKSGDLPPMLDCEWPERVNWLQWGCTAGSIAAWLAAALDEIDDRFGRRGVVYTDPEWWESLGGAGLVGFGDRVLWIAEYPIAGAMSAPPAGPAPTVAPWGKATIWQYTDKFVVPGVAAGIDGDVFLGDEQAWQALLAA